MACDFSNRVRTVCFRFSLAGKGLSDHAGLGCCAIWSGKRDLNPQPSAWEAENNLNFYLFPTSYYVLYLLDIFISKSLLARRFSLCRLEIGLDKIMVGNFRGNYGDITKAIHLPPTLKCSIAWYDG